MPCCFDALSARLIERAGFALTFMSGFAVVGARARPARHGPDLVRRDARPGPQHLRAPSAIPVIGDGDTGYGNAVNVKRTVAATRAPASRA